MEFWGFIYDKRYDKQRNFFDSLGNKKEYDEYSINSEKIKKYFVNGKWVFSTTQEYLKTIDLRKYIKRSDTFAKIQFSTELNILKFDYIEKGFFKKQLIIKGGKVISKIGIDSIETDSISLIDIFDNLLWEFLRLDCQFIEPHESYFKTVKNIPYNRNLKETAFDLYLIFSIPQVLVGIIFSPFLVTFTTWLLILIIRNRELWDKQTFTLIFIAWSISIFLPVYLGRLIFKSVKNYLMIRNKVFNDESITLPNRVARPEPNGSGLGSHTTVRTGLVYGGSYLDGLNDKCSSSIDM